VNRGAALSALLCVAAGAALGTARAADTAEELAPPAPSTSESIAASSSSAPSPLPSTSAARPSIEGPDKPIAAHELLPVDVRSPQRITLTLEASYQTRAIYRVPSNAAAVGAGVQIGEKSLRLCVATEIAVGSTDVGLTTIVLTTMLGVDGALGAVRLGAGVDLGSIDIARRTVGTHLFSLTIGTYAKVGLDLWRFGSDDHQSLYAFARGALDYSTDAIWSGTFGVGLRL
jgi:hypothetical protein